MLENTAPGWAFLTNHARVLVCIAGDPGIRLRDLGDRVGITERATHRIVVELATAGYITRRRNGRRNHYTINAHLPLPDPIPREQNIGQLLKVLTGCEVLTGGAAGATAPRTAERSADHDEAAQEAGASVDDLGS